MENIEFWTQAVPEWLKDTDFIENEVNAVIADIIGHNGEPVAVLRLPNGVKRTLSLYRDNQLALSEKFGAPSNCLGKPVKLKLTHSTNKKGAKVSIKTIM